MVVWPTFTYSCHCIIQEIFDKLEIRNVPMSEGSKYVKQQLYLHGVVSAKEE